MSVTMEHGDDMLEFIHPVGMDQFGKAMGAYDKLVRALTGKAPSYTDFTDFLLREGYVKKSEKYVPPDPS